MTALSKNNYFTTILIEPDDIFEFTFNIYIPAGRFFFVKFIV